MDRRGFIAGLLAGFPMLGRIFSPEKRGVAFPKVTPYSHETVYVPKALAGWKAEVDRHVREIPPGALRPCSEGFFYPWRIRVPIGDMPADQLAGLLMRVNDKAFGAVGAGCLRLDLFLDPDGPNPRRFVEFAYDPNGWNKLLSADGVWREYRQPDGTLLFSPADFDQIPDA